MQTMKNPLDIEVGGLVKFDKNSLPCNLVAPGVVGIIMPYSQYVNVVNKGEKASNIPMSVCIETDEHKKVAENLNNLLNEKDYGGTFVSDIVDTPNYEYRYLYCSGICLRLHFAYLSYHDCKYY